MKSYLIAGAVATLAVLGQRADGQQPGSPSAMLPPQQQIYSPQAGFIPLMGVAPGYAVPQQGVNLAALQAAAAQPGAVSNAGCGEGCGAGGSANCDYIQWEIYGDFLYLRPRNAEVAFAVTTNSVVPPPAAPIQVAPVTVVDPDYQPGFRVGFRHYFEPCASIGVDYWHYESDAHASASTDVTPVIQSLVTHPGSASADQPWQEAQGSLDIDFDRVNLDYRVIWSCSDRHELAFVGGAAYAGLEQTFAADFSVIGSDHVVTDVIFDGGGIRLGLEGERHSRRTGLFVYGKSYATFIAGEFRSSYLQSQSFDPVVVNTSWRAGRIVPILDLELGVGWASCSGCLRLSGGYMVSGWYNVVKTDAWIKAVQSNNFVGLSDTMTFDGLVVRGEVRF